ncbi:MAG: hypothetical protein U5L02_00860 [Rheinheimera sp.]|nr:hypothetical protein [Rheinheimera sp.]
MADNLDHRRFSRAADKITAVALISLANEAVGRAELRQTAGAATLDGSFSIFRRRPIRMALRPERYQGFGYVDWRVAEVQVREGAGLFCCEASALGWLSI